MRYTQVADEGPGAQGTGLTAYGSMEVVGGSLPGERRRRGPNAANPTRAVVVLLFTSAALVMVLVGALAATAFSSAGEGKGLVRSNSNGGAAQGGPSPLEEVEVRHRKGKKDKEHKGSSDKDKEAKKGKDRKEKAKEHAKGKGKGKGKGEDSGKRKKKDEPAPPASPEDDDSSSPPSDDTPNTADSSSTDSDSDSTTDSSSGSASEAPPEEPVPSSGADHCRPCTASECKSLQCNPTATPYACVKGDAKDGCSDKESSFLTPSCVDCCSLSACAKLWPGCGKCTAADCDTYKVPCGDARPYVCLSGDAKAGCSNSTADWGPAAFFQGVCTKCCDLATCASAPKCGKCTEDECSLYQVGCGYERPFACTDGAAHGGCAETEVYWQHAEDMGICDRCCDTTTCSSLRRRRRLMR